MVSKIKKSAPPPDESTRYVLIDLLRGAAILLMVAYHFCFDLNYYGVLHQDFNNSAFWLAARTVIVSMFLSLVGVGLVLSARHANPKSYWIRMAKLSLAALAVTLGSYAMFPGSFIFFGILHFILFASLAGRYFVRLYWANLLLGATAIAAGVLFSHAAFDAAPLQWIGFMTYKPITEDYVPVFPWMGGVLLGIFAGRFIFMQNRADWLTVAPSGKPVKFPAWLGRHSLLVYLLHQPILLGILYLALPH
jgi:uncharacterized membrane protein